MADELIEQGGVATREELATVLPSGRHSAVLDDGSYEGLVLQRDTVRMVKRKLDAVDDAIDVKLLRAGNEAARDLTKLAVRVAEGAFKAQQGNTLVALLEALKDAQLPAPGKVEKSPRPPRRR